MPDELICSDCGAKLSPETQGGLCVRCLFTLGLKTEADTEAAATVVPITEKAGDRIGRYKLLQKIGEGGCGVVYMAEQEEPVRRRVALKVIKLGMDTRQVIARFEAERQALALMDHPNIARILDGGATDAGRPYFVMELVKGIRVTEYCDEQKLSTRQRLELFAQICQAIQHAHQKGIIHRDIKPSNILVTLHDGVPVPKVIDFGIAKATDQRLTDKTLFTQLDQFLGTPAYMSPEQAELKGLDVDTRTDISSLGVLLYQLLTGRTPFEAKELFKAGFDEMRRMIREVEPPRPSTRISTLAGSDLTTLAALRQTDPRKLTKLLHGDLDWIVMKALEKDRTRRYETANGFAMDIRRFLADEPVSAAAPSAAYRFGKFVRRHKVTLGVTTAMAFLVIALLVSTLLLVKESRAGKFGGILLKSNPEGAEVWRGGQKVGITPFQLAGIPLGDFTYSLVLRNYESVTNTTTLAPKMQLTEIVLLRPFEPRGTAAVPGLSTNFTELTATAPQGITILGMEGKVQFSRRIDQQWDSAYTNMVLSPGDRLRTGSRSRATMRWPDGSVVRVDELTSMEIQPQTPNTLEKPSLKLKSGATYFFNRDAPKEVPFRTPTSTGQIRG